MNLRLLQRRTSPAANHTRRCQSRIHLLSSAAAIQLVQLPLNRLGDHKHMLALAAMYSYALALYALIDGCWTVTVLPPVLLPFQVFCDGF